MENRCPECGEEFDPQELEEKRAKCRSPKRLFASVFYIPVGIALTYLILLVLAEKIYSKATDTLLIIQLFFACILIPLFSMEAAFRLDETYQVTRGRRNTPWHIESVGPTWLVFMAMEAIFFLFTLIAGIIFITNLFGW